MDARNGMLASELPTTLTWVKSKRSGPNGGNCLELADLGNGEIAARNSRFPDGPALILTLAEVKAAVEGAKDGNFDEIAGIA